MEEKKKLTNEQLEAELGSLRSKATLAKVVTYGAGAGIIFCLITANIALGVVFLVAALVGGSLLSKQTKALKTLLSENIVGSVLNEVFDNVEYNPFGRIPDGQLSGAGMVFPFAHDSAQGSDYVKAEYKGMSVQLSDIELYHTDSYYDEQTQQWRDTEVKVFEGQWLICDFGKELSGQVHLSENTKALRIQHKNDRIEMESEAFNDRFIVTADNAQEAFYILTPHMMEYIISVASKSGGEVYMSFLRGGKLHIAVNTSRDFFELGGSDTNIDSLRQKFLGELRWFTDIIDQLRLEEHFYK